MCTPWSPTISKDRDAPQRQSEKMGHGQWSEQAYVQSTSTRQLTRGAVFAHDQDVRQGRVQTAVHESLNPRGIQFRESRDNAEHPESNAIIVGLDVTGSMSRVVRTIHSKLPTLMNLLTEKGYIKDPQILMAAVGDHHGDRAPLQVGQFESDARVEEHLSNMFLEGGGGGLDGAEWCHESYQLLAYFAAYKTAIDCFEKRNKKPNCGECAYKRSIPGNAHISCENREAKVDGNKFGIERGWFFWPLNFDPAWLKSCDGFKSREG